MEHFSNGAFLKWSNSQIEHFSNGAIWGRHHQLDDSLVGQLTTFQLFEFHIGNKYVWIPFLEKIPFSNRQNIRKDLFG